MSGAKYSLKDFTKLANFILGIVKKMSKKGILLVPIQLYTFQQNIKYFEFLITSNN